MMDRLKPVANKAVESKRLGFYLKLAAKSNMKDYKVHSEGKRMDDIEGYLRNISKLQNDFNESNSENLRTLLEA